MKNFTASTLANLVLCILHLGLLCAGQDDNVPSPMKKTEQEALYSAIQGFAGQWWNGSDLYPDPCGWTPIQGVSCDFFDGFWYVTELSIGPVHDNSLVCAQNVQFRTHFFVLKHLRSLSFYNCFISRDNPVTIPADWNSLASSLESLEFRTNPGLIGQVPSSFGDLTKLESLVLIENGLRGELPTNIGNVIGLKRLVLSGNFFTGRIPDNFGALNRLLILDMSRNSLSGPLPSTFGGLASLLKLDLSNNQLEGEIPDELRNLKNLTLLDLSKNTFSGGLTKSLQEMNSLEELVLSNNPTGGDIMGIVWQNLRDLKTLDLSNMSLTGGIPEAISELKGLRFLGLNDNKFRGEIPPKLAFLPNISAIYLNGNNLTGELKFSELFYGKMGRRFGAWNNPNLCYPVGLMSTSHVPYGVKQCQQEIPQNEVDLKKVSNLGNRVLGHNYNSNSMASLGFSICRSYGFRYIFLVEVLMLALL